MLITIEGIDGSGKNTQAVLLKEKLQLQFPNRKVSLISFPDYGNNLFAKEVGYYLDGKYGTIEEVPVKFACMMYAGDRYMSRDKILELSSGDNILICDRYVESNLAHQVAKLHTENEKQELRDWLHELEYGCYNLPKPDLTIWLSLPVSISTELVLKKKARSYTDNKQDLHESVSGYLRQVSNEYAYLSSINSWWKQVPCISLVNGETVLNTIENVSSTVFNTVCHFIK